MVALLCSVWMTGSATAQSSLDCSGIVVNGSFEEPTAVGWNGVARLVNHAPYAADGTQFIYLSVSGGTTWQDLDTSGLLAGDTITITFWHDEAVVATLGSTSVTTANWPWYETHAASVSYTLIADAEPVRLSFAKAPGTTKPIVDAVSASCTRVEPTPEPTVEPTIAPTIAPTEPPLATPVTQEPTAVPVTEEPTSEPTSVPAQPTTAPSGPTDQPAAPSTSSPEKQGGGTGPITTLPATGTGQEEGVSRQMIALGASLAVMLGGVVAWEWRRASR